VITGLNSLHSTIQSPVAGKEISVSTFSWERLRFDLWLLLCGLVMLLFSALRRVMVSLDGWINYLHSGDCVHQTLIFFL
jgi:hypothetical protein